MAVHPDLRRGIPQVERIARRLEDEGGGLPRAVLVDAARAAAAAARREARLRGTIPSEEEVVARAVRELRARRAALLQPVINATGVLLHTNLGRAPLSQAALEAVRRVCEGYSNLELDLQTGRRGDRFRHVEPLLALATGAEAALVVNNNAAAVLLACAALARGREVVVSRGELIEIGGEFRIPEILAESGARLVEVGTTNRTHLRDYERAIGPDTAFVLKVHPSNYRMIGFTASPPCRELAALAHRRGVPLVYDTGSGLVGRELFDEPPVPQALADGADLVCCSGDKLLGGPQAGILCGRARLLAPLRRHPLLRALRPDKMTLAALQATVLAYLGGAGGELPVWRMLDADFATLRRRARALARALRDRGAEAEVQAGESVAGGGSLPGEGIPSPVVRIRHPKPAELAAALREHDPPVIARVEGRALVVDVRTVPPPLDRTLAAALADALTRCG